MKTAFIRLAVIAVLASACMADDTSDTNQDAFVPNNYLRYQKWLLPKKQVDEALAGGTNYINALLGVIETPMPDPALWQRKDAIYNGSAAIPDSVRERLMANDRQFTACSLGAETLQRLVSHGIRFTPDQIDRLVKSLSLPASSVTYNIHVALARTFGVGFTDPQCGVQEPVTDHKKYLDAWRKFWSQNRDRYGSDLPWIINDLCLDVKPVKTNGAACLQVTIANHGTNDWDIVAEAPGAMKIEFGKYVEWDRVYALLLGEKRIYPIEPASYVISTSCRVPSPSQIRSIPDRPVHLERVRIQAGQQYSYLLNLAESFPKEDLRHKDIVLCYGTGEGTNIKAPFWRGELRSNTVRLE